MTEKEIFTLIKNKTDNFFGCLYEEYSPYMFGIILRYHNNYEEAQDILHDVFLKIYDNIDTFKYRQEGSLKAWITRICINEILMLKRKEKKIKILPIEERDDIDPESLEDPQVDEVEKIPINVLEEFIAELPEGYKIVFNLYVIDGLSHKEIGKILGINEKSSSSQLARAKQYLKKRINLWIQENNLE